MCSAVGESDDVLSIVCKFERGGTNKPTIGRTYVARNDSEKK